MGIVMLLNESGLKANYLASIVKNAAYRILAGENRRDVAAWMDEQAAVLARRVDGAEAELAAIEAEKASMPWSLTANADAYVGTYSHELAGTIEISRSGADGLSVSWGNLRGLAYAHPNQDTIDVMFRPGSYYPMAFYRSGTAVDGLTIHGYRFARE